jgi:hypothetical protein
MSEGDQAMSFGTSILYLTSMVSEADQDNCESNMSPGYVV